MGLLSALVQRNVIHLYEGGIESEDSIEVVQCSGLSPKRKVCGRSFVVIDICIRFES